MPRPARACGGSASRSRPSNSTLPPPRERGPMRLRISVVLPAPFLPTRPTRRPSRTPRERPRSATTESIATWSERTDSIALLRDQLAGDVAAHVLARERGRRRTVGDDAAGIERDDAAGVVLDDVHVVLDEEHGHLLLA